MNKKLIFLILGLMVIIVAVKLIFFSKPAVPKITEIRPGFFFPKNCLAGDSVAYEDTTSGVTTRQWNFGNNHFSTSKSGKTIYDSAGIYHVILTVNGKYTHIDTIQVKAKDVAIKTAAFEIIGPDTDFAGKKIQFSTTATGANTYHWNFGDDNSAEKNNESTDKDPFHTYKVPGSYSVKLITDLGENFVIHSITIKHARHNSDDNPNTTPTKKTPAYKPPTDKELEAWLNKDAAGKGNFDEDDDYLAQNFSLGKNTPVKWTHDSKTQNTSIYKVLSAFDKNPGRNQIISVKSEHDHDKFISKIILKTSFDHDK